MTTPPPPSPVEPQQPASGSGDDKNLVLISHFGMVLFGFWPALIIYLVKGDNPYVKSEAAKAFNFSIIPSAALLVLQILSFAVLSTGSAIGCLFSLLIFATWVAMATFGIMAGIKVNDGKEATYPAEVPILK